ncbi:MAG TPA: hypothetical protein VEL05_12170 [Candidatus Acidoferrum sp.]|nr:hypothetical protein [Candidatus Acidoferrum sp.]
MSWGEAEGVPLFLGELGLIHHCFELGRGGTNWVADMLDLLAARGLHFSYHAYHEPAFGIFQSAAAERLPDLADANQPLIDRLRESLAGP